MIPAFYKGDILIISGQKNYEVGDVIVFSPTSSSTPIVHRVIKVNNDNTLQTMGDANNGMQLPFEKSITYDQIHGKMILKIPYLGWVKIGLMEYIAPNILLIVLILVPLTIIYIKFR
jgi:signal peptidase I